jgi:hypothetical protein
MNENQKKTLTMAATAAGYIVWFMGKEMTSGVRTRKGTGRKFWSDIDRFIRREYESVLAISWSLGLYFTQGPQREEERRCDLWSRNS